MSFKEADNCVSGRIVPKSDNVLVRLEPPPKQFSYSLIIEPDRNYTKVEAAYATVVATGSGDSYRKHCNQCHRPYDRYADELNPGDRVLLDSDKAGDIVMVEGVEHRIVKMAEIHGVIES